GWHDTGLSSSIRHERPLASRIRPFARTTPRCHVKPRRGSAPPGRWPRTPTAIRASTLVSRETWKGTCSVTTVSCSAGRAAGALAIGTRSLLGTNELTLMRPATPRRGGTHYRSTPECRRVRTSVDASIRQPATGGRRRTTPTAPTPAVATTRPRGAPESESATVRRSVVVADPSGALASRGSTTYQLSAPRLPPHNAVQ